jgi:hypothetical protein
MFCFTMAGFHTIPLKWRRGLTRKLYQEALPLHREHIWS